MQLLAYLGQVTTEFNNQPLNSTATESALFATSINEYNLHAATWRNPFGETGETTQRTMPRTCMSIQRAALHKTRFGRTLTAIGGPNVGSLIATSLRETEISMKHCILLDLS
jgi:hypothetical protein